MGTTPTRIAIADLHIVQKSALKARRNLGYIFCPIVEGWLFTLPVRLRKSSQLRRTFAPTFAPADVRMAGTRRFARGGARQIRRPNSDRRNAKVAMIDLPQWAPFYARQQQQQPRSGRRPRRYFRTLHALSPAPTEPPEVYRRRLETLLPKHDWNALGWQAKAAMDHPAIHGGLPDDFFDSDDLIHEPSPGYEDFDESDDDHEVAAVEEIFSDSPSPIAVSSGSDGEGEADDAHSSDSEAGQELPEWFLEVFPDGVPDNGNEFDNISRHSSEAAPSLPSISSPVSVRSNTFSVGSRSASEAASSEDSLFVDQRPRNNLHEEVEGLHREQRVLGQDLDVLLGDRQRLDFAEHIEQSARQLRELGERIRRSSEAIQRSSEAYHREARRHQPYPHPNPRRNQRGAAHRGEDRFGDNEMDEDDQLVEMEVISRRSSRRDRMRTPNQARARSPPAVIDLTEEPDSPEQPQVLPRANRRNRTQQPARAASRAPQLPRNPRRHGSLNHLRRTPSLARSDGSILGGAPVIDLTGMDDDAPAPARAGHIPERPVPMPARNVRQGQLPPFEHIDLVSQQNEVNPSIFGAFGQGWRMSDFAGFGFIQRRLGNLGNARGQRAELDVQILGGPNFGPADFPGPPEVRNNPNVANPLAENLPNFNYQANGYNNGPPKPVYVPPPPPKEGFTRSTGDDLEFVCPGCEEELKYDPDEEEAKSPPTKKARTRKDREEHHFWAVKDCGHVSSPFVSVFFL